jgi:hypothetical protein
MAQRLGTLLCNMAHDSQQCSVFPSDGFIRQMSTSSKLPLQHCTVSLTASTLCLRQVSPGNVSQNAPAAGMLLAALQPCSVSVQRTQPHVASLCTCMQRKSRLCVSLGLPHKRVSIATGNALYICSCP